MRTQLTDVAAAGYRLLDALGPTETTVARSTTSSLRELAITRGLRTVDEVVWGDALFDGYTSTVVRDLGQSALPGRPVAVQD